MLTVTDTEVKMTEPDDIASLPWGGNFAVDNPLFTLCEEYIRGEPDLGKRQRAFELTSLHGYGEPYTCPPDYDPLTEISPRSGITLDSLRMSSTYNKPGSERHKLVETLIRQYAAALAAA